MQQETFRSHVDGRLYRRINKATARKVYDNGKTIFMQSCNIRFDSMWQSACPITPDGTTSFDSVVNAFQYYNCDSERGRYPHYYIEVK